MGIESLHHRLSEIVAELVGRGLPLRQARRQFERQYLLAALRLHEGSLTRAAEHLGVHRNTLRNRLDELGVRSKEYRRAPGRNTPA
ncbi:MAG TPA: helix-turn-helix domain-containing protein [Thermoanaerobaculia bacterium]|nr:helix-turn-helix domain-containing protein [Thermoanaerobaculia bacterium]